MAEVRDGSFEITRHNYWDSVPLLLSFPGCAGGDTVGQVIAANMDRVIVVAGLDGEYSIHRITLG